MMEVTLGDIDQICREIGSDKTSNIQKRINNGYSFVFIEKIIDGGVTYIGIKCVDDSKIILY